MAATQYLIRAFLLMISVLSFFTLGGEVTPSMEDCNVEIAKSISFGLSYGSPFCAMQIKQGHFVNGIKIWHHSGGIKALQIKYTNGETTTIGDPKDDIIDELNWDPSVLSIREAWTWPDPFKMIHLHPERTENIQGLCIVLSNDQKILASGSTKLEDYGGDYFSEVPSGTLLGLSGMYGGNGIEALTFHMLNGEVKNAAIHDVKFTPSADELNRRGSNKERGLLLDTIWTVHFFNHFDYDYNLVFEDKQTVETSTTWTNTTSNGWHLGASVEIEHEANFIAAKAKMTENLEFFWEQRWDKSNMAGEKQSHEVKYGINAPIKPGKGIKAWAYMVTGHWDAEWSAKVTCTVGSKEFTFPTTGTLKNIQYSEAWVNVEEEKFEDMEASIARGDGHLINEAGERISLDDLSLGGRLGRRWIA